MPAQTLSTDPQMFLKMQRLTVMAVIAACVWSCSNGQPGATVDVDAFRSRIAADPGEVMPLLPGMPAPAFSVTHADGSRYEFSTGPRDKPLVITFYRGGWCPYCRAFLWKMREAEQALLDLGYELVFISADRVEELAPALEEKELSYTLLSDNDLVAARAFGIAFRVTDEYFNRLLDNDIDLEQASGRTHHALPVPATFVIGTDGVIDFLYLNPDYKARVHPDVLVAAARTSLQDTD